MTNFLKKERFLILIKVLNLHNPKYGKFKSIMPKNMILLKENN